MATNAHETTWYIANNWETYYASAVLSGIVGDPDHQKNGGYHISIENNSPSNYSVTRPDDKAPPGDWPRNLAAAIDMSMSSEDMKLCSDRLWAVWNNRANDPRAQYINAFNGWFNDGGPAKRYDYYSGSISETSSDHKWHVHLEIRRRWVTSMVAANAILSILRGESLEQYLANSGSTGEEDMYAKKGMGLNGSPISHNTMYLQEMLMFFIDPADPRLVEHPLTIDGKYGSNTAWWTSVILTGGPGEEVTGSWFAKLDRMVAAKCGNIEVAGHLANTTHGGGSLPDTVDLVIPARTIEIPEVTITADVS